MKRENNNHLIPVQPYVNLKAEKYEKIIENHYGISLFYEFSLKEELKEQVKAVPDGSVDLLFGIGENSVHTYLGGTVLEVKHWPLFNGDKYFGVRFEPGKVKLPKDICIKDIVNNDIEIDENSFGNKLSEKIAEAKDINERSKIFMDNYIKILDKNDELDNIHSIEEYIRERIYRSKGNISIKELSKETGYSECYVRRIFKSVHGISPKSFEKFVRFQYVLNKIDKLKGNVQIEDIALDCGYYDQSHMIKDFKCFAGITPESYLKVIHKY